MSRVAPLVSSARRRGLHLLAGTCGRFLPVAEPLTSAVHAQAQRACAERPEHQDKDL